MRVAQNGRFDLETTAGRIDAESMVIATGGLSIPKMGATAFGYEIARQFGLRVVECRPALTPLLWSREDADRFGDLAGVSMEVVASCGKSTFREKMLFTHRGVSGPAILQISSYWRPGQGIAIDLLPGVEAPANLRRVLPRRFVERWPNEDDIHSWRIQPAGLEGYEKAEVTAGGVDTAELSSKTMEAKKAPGLYFIGEVVDVTGQLGGFNFQWAWAAGYSAGQYV
jgi:predicted flavoprotein YhiN